MVCGVQKRFAFEPPTPDPILLEELKEFIQAYCTKNFKPLPANADLSFETWLSKTPYPAWRKAALTKVFSNLQEKPLNLKKISNVNSFMKKETYPEYKYPRGINSRSDEFKCIFGPYIKAMEEVIYSHPAFIKHVPVRERASYVDEYIYAPGHVYMATDYSQYESHFTKEIMEHIEFVVYKHLMSNNTNNNFLACLKIISGTNECSFRAFKVALAATRMSGEMNTSLGNGVSNFFLTLFVLFKRGYTIDEIRTVVEGDDGLTRVDPKNIPTSDDFERLGFTIKIEVYSQISDASFCGLVYDPTDKQTITDPRDVLQNFYWLDALRYGKASNRRLLELMRCKALSALYQYPGCPIIKAMAGHMLRLTKTVRHATHWVNAYDSLIDLEAIRYLTTDLKTLRDDNVDLLLGLPIGIGSRLLVESKYKLDIRTQLRLELHFTTSNKMEPINDYAVVEAVTYSARHYYDTYVCNFNPQMQRCKPMCSYVDLTL